MSEPIWAHHAAEATAALTGDLASVIPSELLTIVQKSLQVAWMEGVHFGADEAIVVMRRELVRAING